MNFEAKKINSILIVVIAVAVLVLAAGGLFLYRQNSKTKLLPSVSEKVPAEAKYAKGSVAFFYPVDWKLNDIPASLGFISVQVGDPKDMIVFTASSNDKFFNNKVEGDLKYEKEIILGGVKGKERLWEYEKAQAVIFRADGFEFQNRHYRFEMFTNPSRKVKAEKIWREILASVKFAETEEEKIEAKPAQ